MKKIGKEVLFIEAKGGVSRNGEGSFARLSDGRIIYAYTEFCDSIWYDDAVAHICACYSSDEGESWSEPVVILEKDEKAENIMSVSLFTLNSGELGMIYARKEKSADGLLNCMPFFISSADLGKSWSAPVACIDTESYYCPVNDSVTVDRNGRIYLPLSCHRADGDTEGSYINPFIIPVYSDDNGKSWSTLCKLRSPYSDGYGLAEPGIYIHENGDMWVYCRTPYGFQYFSRSFDGGESWSPMRPQLCFSSPDSPMRVKRLGNITAAVFNPVPYNCTCTEFEDWKSAKRTPLVCAVSRDDGLSFAMNGETLANGSLLGFAANAYYIEDDPASSYCYPAMIETRDGILVAYYHSNGTPICLNSCKITKIYKNEIE